MELDIDIFYHSDETEAALERGMEYSVLECDSRQMTFYNISAIAPYEDEKSEKWFCKIFIPGNSFIATKSYEEIKQIIHDHKRQNS